MNKRIGACFCLIAAGVFFLMPGKSAAQEMQFKAAVLLKRMPDFSLPFFQGGTINLSDLKGKNVLIYFPRGLAGKDHWCHVCNYQYAEMVELEMKKKIRKRYNVEILFVLPYSRTEITDWVAKFAKQLADIEKWKNPDDVKSLNESQRKRLEMIKTHFPKRFEFENNRVPIPFPILMDSEKTVSKGLGIFRTDWGGSQIEQNIPSVYIIDKKGVLQFKYHSQNTFDRPGPDYLIKFLSWLNK